MKLFKTTCTDGSVRRLILYMKDTLSFTAHVMIYGQSVTGRVEIDRYGYRFIPNVAGKNRGVWDDPDSCSKMAEKRRIGD